MQDPSTFQLTSKLLPDLIKKIAYMHRERDLMIDQISDAFGDPLNLAKNYIVPNCQHFNPADKNEDEAPNILQASVFDMIENFLDKDMQIRDGRSQLFILSDAGMGKTSLLVMMKLFHLTSFWPKKYNCVLKKLGPKTIPQIRDIYYKRKTVLLLDALDEDPMALLGIRKRIADILEETVNFKRVLITCRTQFFPSARQDPLEHRGMVEVANFRCPVIYLSLFNDQQIEAYLDKRFPKTFFGWLTGKTSKKVVEAQKLVKSMHSLRCRPMLLAHIEDLLESQNSCWDKYTIYDKLVESWLLRELRKLRSLEDKPASKDDLLYACTRVAFAMFKAGRQTISLDELGILIKRYPQTRYLKVIDVGGRSLLNRNSTGEYRFSHYSIHEFLAARYILTRGIDEPCHLTTTTGQVRIFISSYLRDVRPRADGHRRGHLNLMGLDLERIDLSGCNLQGIRFGKSNLRWSDLREANMNYSDLAEAKLDHSLLHGAKLKRAKIDGTSFIEASCDQRTDWPDGFRPSKVGILVEVDSEEAL